MVGRLERRRSRGTNQAEAAGNGGKLGAGATGGSSTAGEAPRRRSGNSATGRHRQVVAATPGLSADLRPRTTDRKQSREQGRSAAGDRQLDLDGRKATAARQDDPGAGDAPGQPALRQQRRRRRLAEPSFPDAACPAGSRREFEPLRDLHVGVITSSLGSHGATGSKDVCTTAKTTTRLT